MSFAASLDVPRPLREVAADVVGRLDQPRRTVSVIDARPCQVVQESVVVAGRPEEPGVRAGRQRLAPVLGVGRPDFGRVDRP